MRTFVRLLALIVSSFALISNLGAQSGVSLVEGRVQDSTGAVIQEADVALTSASTGVRAATRTNGDGLYLFPSVQPGLYTLEISKSGFNSWKVSGLRVTAAQRATQDATLQTGSILESVTVDAGGAAALVEPTSNELGTLVESESVRKLPLNGRDFLQLALLSGAAQTSGTTVSDFTTLQVGHPDRAIVINGNEQDMNGYFINGISTAGSRLGQASLNLSVAAIDQFKIHEGFFLPGEAPIDSGAVSVASRAGTNHIHGEAFAFVRNYIFDARNFFDKPGGQPAPFRRNQFGGALGGPILHNRLFAFGHYEGRRQLLSGTARATVPSAQMFDGDFSELLGLATPIQLYDPATFDEATGQRQPFDGNIIPPARINSMASKLLAFYKSAPAYSTENLIGNPRTTDNYDQFGVRVDSTLNQKHQLFSQYVHENSPTVNAALFPLSGFGFPLTTDFAMVQATSTLMPNLVNILRVGWLRPYIFSAGDTQAGIQNDLGFTGTADPNGLPGIFLDGFNISGSATAPSFGRNQGLIGNIDNQYQIHDGLNLLRGSHEIAFGFDLNYVRTVQESSNFYSRGGVWFAATYTAQLAEGTGGQLAPVAHTGNSFADFLLGMPLNGSVTSMPRTHFRWTAVSPYVQDTWRVRPGLTVNMGLVWNLSTPPNAVGSDSLYPHGFDFSTGKVKYAAIGDTTSQVYSLDRTNFAPRAGFVWQPKFLPRTTVRAGAGYYYPAENALYELFAITAPGVAIVQAIANSPASPQPTYLLGQNVFPPITQTPITREFADNVTGVVFALDSKLRTTYIQQWSAAIQYAVTPSTIAEIDYIGSQSRKLPIRWNADDCSIADSYLCDQSVRPWPQYSYVYAYANAGTSSYNAMVLKLQRQFARGLSFTANYTWSKALTNTEQGGAPVGINQRGTCLSCDKGLAGFNVPQRLVLSSVWSLPLGAGHRYLTGMHPAANAVVSGWTMNAIATFAGGNPFTILAANSTAMDPMISYRPDRVCDGRSSLQNRNLRTNGRYWIDTSCFVHPAANYFGTSGANILTGPGVNNWDFGLSKLIPLHESINIEVRAEAFNAFNHAQFLNPQTLMTDANFGRVTTANPARQLQFALKLLW